MGHDAEYFRIRRARQREAAIAAGTFGISARYSKPSTGRKPGMEEIPAEVYTRGLILRKMMRTPHEMWSVEWLLDVESPK
jgi:hypothetical protein